MPALNEIEKQVQSLPKKDYESFRKWFYDFDDKIWEQEIQRDAEKGILDFLIKEAKDERTAGTLKDL